MTTHRYMLHGWYARSLTRQTHMKASLCETCASSCELDRKCHTHRHVIIILWLVWVLQTHHHDIIWVGQRHRHVIIILRLVWVRQTHHHDIIIFKHLVSSTDTSACYHHLATRVSSTDTALCCTAGPDWYARPKFNTANHSGNWGSLGSPDNDNITLWALWRAKKSHFYPSQTKILDGRTSFL
jgi:hypothetical protein